MNISIKKLLLACIIVLTASSSLFGQRNITYRDLAERTPNQSTFFDTIILPGNSADKVQFITLFRFNYATLPFKKIQNPEGNAQFFSTASLSIEVFKGEKENRDSQKNISVDGLNSVTRSFWRDTAFAISYQQTKSDHTFMGGHLPVQLDPGYYHYILQLSRGEDANEMTSRTQSVEIIPFEKRKTGSFIMIDSVSNRSDGKELSILNFGGNVYYGKDFYTLVHLPGYNPSVKHTLTINRIDIAERDTTARDRIFSETLSKSDIYTGYKPVLKSDKSNPTLLFNESQTGLAYALVKIPNSSFPNAVFRIRINQEGQNKPVAQSVFRSKWIDMPTSLLNLNVAIDMLHYIADRSTIREMKRGNDSEKEQKFRDYWEKRDPTPKTEFNELMAEYYRRIDYAYEHFTTINTIGYESDRGKIYIKYGSPDNIERKFPAGGTTMEIWSYGSQQFVFRATTGFGDFKLISGE